MLSEFFTTKVSRGEMRAATQEELAETNCTDYWHRMPMHQRSGGCPKCKQRLKGWLYEI